MIFRFATRLAIAPAAVIPRLPACSQEKPAPFAVPGTRQFTRKDN